MHRFFSNMTHFNGMDAVTSDPLYHRWRYFGDFYVLSSQAVYNNTYIMFFLVQQLPSSNSFKQATTCILKLKIFIIRTRFYWKGVRVIGIVKVERLLEVGRC